MSNISNITTKLSRLSVWITYHAAYQWIHIVEWIAPFVKKIAGWSVLKARTKQFDVEKKIQFNGFYLTRGHYSSSGATFHDAKTGKIIYYVLCVRM